MMKQLFIKLLFVSGLLKQEKRKIALRRRAYICMLFFPYFIFLLVRAFFLIWKSRLYNRKMEGIAYKYY